MAQRLLYIYVIFFSLLLSTALVLLRETGASQSSRDARFQERVGSGAEAREADEDCPRWVDFRVNADTSTPPQPLGLQFAVQHQGTKPVFLSLSL